MWFGDARGNKQVKQNACVHGDETEGGGRVVEEQSGLANCQEALFAACEELLLRRNIGSVTRDTHAISQVAHLI